MPVATKPPGNGRNRGFVASVAVDVDETRPNPEKPEVLSTSARRPRRIAVSTGTAPRKATATKPHASPRKPRFRRQMAAKTYPAPSPCLLGQQRPTATRPMHYGSTLVSTLTEPRRIPGNSRLCQRRRGNLIRSGEAGTRQCTKHWRRNLTEAQGKPEFRRQRPGTTFDGIPLFGLAPCGRPGSATTAYLPVRTRSPLQIAQEAAGALWLAGLLPESLQPDRLLGGLQEAHRRHGNRLDPVPRPGPISLFCIFVLLSARQRRIAARVRHLAPPELRL